MERSFIKKLILMVLVAAVSVFFAAKVVNAAPVTLNGGSFSDIESSASTNNTANNVVNTTSNNTTNSVNNTTSNKVNNATQSNTSIPQTGSNSIVYFISGCMVLAVISVISITLYSKIKLS